MTNDKERLAFEAAIIELCPGWSLEPDGVDGYHQIRTDAAWIGWQAALASRPQDEPVAWMVASEEDPDDAELFWGESDAVHACLEGQDPTPLYTAPPQRKPLSEQQMKDIANGANGRHPPISQWQRDRIIMRAVEQAITGEKS